MDWDLLVGIIVILIIILVIFAKVSRQTIVEVLEDLKDFLTGGGEMVEEKVTQVYD